MKLAVLDIGVQDFAVHTGLMAFDARLPEPPTSLTVGPGKPIALAWTLR